MKCTCIKFCVFVVLFSACKDENHDSNQFIINETDSSKKRDVVAVKVDLETQLDTFKYREDVLHTDPGALEFRHEFIFSYKNKLDAGVVSILHDSINKLVLYEPEDDMTDFVIIDSTGTVYSFYSGEHDTDYVYSEQLTFTADTKNSTYPKSKKLVPVEKIDATYRLDGTKFNMLVYTFEGYRATYNLSQTSLDFYITDQIAVNSEQLHAFGQLINNDWSYPIAGAHLPGIISNAQIIGKLTDAYGTEIILKSYTPTTYWAQISDYTYIKNESSEDWQEAPLPLLQFLKQE